MKTIAKLALGFLGMALMFNQAFGAVNLTEMQKAFARLDKAFIPALALTSAEKIKPSAKAMEILQSEWRLFNAAYQDANLADGQWRADFDLADQAIENASKIVDGGTGLVAAHVVLEQIRLAFWKLRERNGIDYFTDYLTEFHEEMEVIVLAVKGKNPSSLTESDVTKIREHLPSAKAGWERVIAANLNAELFSFSEAQIGQIHALLGKEKAALMDLEEVLKGNNREELIKASAAIKPIFAQVFKMFGDFRRIG